MSDIERRLHHAGRELRSMEIEPPPLATITSSRVSTHRPSGLAGRVPALVMPVLFVLGGLAVIGGALGQTTPAPESLPADRVAVAPAGDLGGAANPDLPRVTLTAHQELALIASLRPTAPARAPESSAGEQVRSLSRQYR